MEEQQKTLRIPLAESFYSIQGEGLFTGKPSVFIRLGGCNILCKSDTWVCDTIEVWRKSKSKTFQEIIDPYDDVLKKGTVSIVITGGEPLMHDKNLTEFVKYIRDRYQDYDLLIQIETNGTIVPSDELLSYDLMFNVSPKLESSGVAFDKRYNPEAITKLSRHSSLFKFVVSKSTLEQDLKEIETHFVPYIREKNQIFLMPAGDTKELLEEQREAVVEACKQHGYHFTDRLHITIYNKKTGV